MPRSSAVARSPRATLSVGAGATNSPPAADAVAPPAPGRVSAQQRSVREPVRGHGSFPKDRAIRTDADRAAANGSAPNAIPVRGPARPAPAPERVVGDQKPGPENLG